MAYDYCANVTDDVLTYINDEIRPGEYWDRDELAAVVIRLIMLKQKSMYSTIQIF